MSKYKVLLTCAGGPAAVGASKSLLSLLEFDVYIVTVDSDPNAVGLTDIFCDASYTVPQSSKVEEYWCAIIDIIQKEKINLIIPTGDMDVWHFARNKEELEEMGVTVYLSDLDTIMICQNKDMFYSYCHESFPLPFTSTDFMELKLPMYAKPTKGSGGRGGKLCEAIHDINATSMPTNIKYIYQEYLPGVEYSVDTLSDLKGNVITCVVRERMQTKAGISTKGRIIRDNHIESLCADMCKHLNIVGPSCMQLKEDANGQLKFVEVNPRLGGGTYFTTLAGVNIPKLMLQSLEGEAVAPTPKEITVVRYFEEVVL